MNMTDSNRPAESLAELLALHDQAFVRCAYLTLLGRPVDSDGLRSYLRLVRQGERKISIVSRLARSTEGRAFAADLAGLSKALGAYRLSRWPLIGRFFLLALKRDGDSPRERRLRGIENAVYANADDILGRLDRLESMIASHTPVAARGGIEPSPTNHASKIVSPATAKPANGGFLPASGNGG